MTDSFTALVVEQPGPAEFRPMNETDLPDYPILVAVQHSTVNYKDALAVTGRGKICRRLPMVCGIDLAGRILQSDDPNWEPGSQVLINGFGLSETEWGGYCAKQRVRGEWLVRSPEPFASADTMAIGTAGYTAMLCAQALTEHGLTPSSGPVLVTGATGGVGSFALMLLNKMGFEVHAATGRPEHRNYLLSIGASDTVDRAQLDRLPRPLERERWAGAIDCVGGPTLAAVLAQTQYRGIVAACGLAGSAELPASVMPFILRGVTLQGIDSVMAPQPVRQRAWDALSELIDPGSLNEVARTVAMGEVPRLAHELLDGQLRGRLVVDVNEPS